MDHNAAEIGRRPKAYMIEEEGIVKMVLRLKTL
jgi:hypothetical protein